MSDIFEIQNERSPFAPRLPETPETYRPNARIDTEVRLPETPGDVSGTSSKRQRLSNEEAGDLFQSWNEQARQQTEFRKQSPTGLSLRENNLLHDMREKGIVDDDDIYRIVSSKELGEYLGLDPAVVYANYDALWQAVSENRFALPKSRMEAIRNSIQIAKNMEPLGRMGMDLMSLHGKLGWVGADERETLQKQADDLWAQITELQKANEQLGQRMPKDALSQVITATIQSAPLTGKAILGGGLGLAISGGIGALTGPGGFAAGAKIGYNLGSFAASSADMTGMMYVDLLAAGVEQDNARRLAALGGSINGFIELGLGVVAGWGKSVLKLVGGKVVTKEMQAKIAESASKNFIKKITTSGAAQAIGKNIVLKTAMETAKQAGEEGIEEVLQYFVEQAMSALGDAMQDAPVDRNTWGSPEFWSEMKQSFWGGICGGIGFGIAGLPLTFVGNASEMVRQTAALKNLAVTIDDKAEFRVAAKESPLTKNMTDEQIDAMYDSQAPRRAEAQAAETALAEELKNRRLYSAIDQSGEVYRQGDDLYMEHSRHTESSGLETGEFAAGDPRKGDQNSYARGRYELRGEKAAITEFKIGEKYEGLREEMLQNFANDIGKTVEYQGEQYTPNGEGRSMRFGWGQEGARPMAETARQEARRYGRPDTHADIQAKETFTRQLQALDTRLEGEAAARTVTDFYDTVGRKWFGMKFDAFMQRLAGENRDKLFTQTLSDEQVARWVAKNEGFAADAAAVTRIRENLTDEQREAARENIHGFTAPGADGVTKAIYAARDADVSTFIHEGVHAFTALVQATDAELYRQMMEAAGFDRKAYEAADAAGRERMTRQAMETLAYGAEAYLKEGAVPAGNSVLQNLYARIKEFLKDLADAARKVEYLTPETRALFDGLFGEQNSDSVGQGQETAGTTQRKGRNATEGAQKAATEQQGANTGELEIYSDSFDRVIKDKSLPVEERSEAAVRKAGWEYFQQGLEEINSRFNTELDQFLEGKIEKGHIFKLGTPGEILRRTGFPAGQEIQLYAARLEEKSTQAEHPFNPGDLKNLAKAINEPVAVFAYGDRAKAQNVIIEIQQGGKNYLIGIHFNQNKSGAEISNIRTLFPKDNHEWLNWINQGKLLYANTEKLQAVIAQQQINSADVSRSGLERQAPGEATQQRTNSAEVGYLDLKPIERLIQEHADVKHYFPVGDDIYFSEAFRDQGLTDFIVNYPEVVKEASHFESGAEMAEHYADYGAMPDEVYRKANVAGYFDQIARAAKAGDASAATNAIADVSAQKAKAALGAYGTNATAALEAANLVRQENWKAAVDLLEKQGVPRIDAETYAETAKAFSRSEMLWLEKAATAEKTSAETKKTADSPSVETVRLGEDNAAVQKYFNPLVDSAKEIYPDTTVEQSVEALQADNGGEERTARTFIDFVNTEKGFDDLIRSVWATLREGPQQGYTDAQTRQNEATFDRVRMTFNPEGNGNWHVALSDITAGRKVNDHTKKIIQGMIRNRPLQYMEAWAMITGDEAWMPQRPDLERIRRLDTEGLMDDEYLSRQSPEELERIGNQLADDRIRDKINNRTLLVDDPDLNHYEKQLRADMKRAQELIAERKDGLKDYRQYLDMAEQNARKEHLLLEQKAKDTSKEGLRASRKQTEKVAKAQQSVQATIAEMERFIRQDLTPTARAAFLELRNQLREQQRIQAELKAIEQIRDMKITDFRQILRKPDLKAVDVGNAAKIEWIQAHFDNYEAIARYIGKGAKDIRKLYNEFATSAEYRETLKKKLFLSPGAYSRIERIVFKDAKNQEVRAYGELDAGKRRILYRNLLDFEGIFQEMGIDITAEPRKFGTAEWQAMRTEMQDVIPADLMSKLERLLEPDSHAEKNARTGRKFTVDQFNIDDLQTLAGIVSTLRKEGRENYRARRDARTQMREEARKKIIKTLNTHKPKGADDEDRTQGIAETQMKESKRSGKKAVWYSLHNARRFFRMLEGGTDGYLYDYITSREYDAFDTENRYVFARREKVERLFKENGIDIKDLGKITFDLWNGNKATLDEMLTFYYAQYNERALHAAIFGDFATPREREALRVLADLRDIKGQMDIETEIAARYWGDLKKLDIFFTQEGNQKYRTVMDIIGADYDEHYGRLKDFVAREYNEALGSEAYYMPLQRLEMAAQENTEVEQALSDAGLSRYISKGFTKGRTDIPSFAQQPIKAGLYSLWDSMLVKHEHLMAYDPLMRELKQVFEGRGSEVLRDTLKRGHSEAAVEYVRKFISEMGSPPVQEDLAAMNKMNRILRGHYPAAVLGGRIASILKQAVESPPPFFQYVTPAQYAAAAASCLRQETRDMIYEKSVYMKARYFDPAAAAVNEMHKMYMGGKLDKAEALLARAENISMKGQEWIDAVCVMPGWLAAFSKKTAELKQSSPNLSVQEAEAQAVRYADQVMRDCQPSSVLMDQIPLLKGDKHPLVRMFMQFQTPIASIFQQLFIDAPADIKNGRVLHAAWTWGIYALLAMVIGAMHDDDDEDKDAATLVKHRLIDAGVMPLEMIPVLGGDLSYSMESLLRDGKIRPPRRSYFPVADQGIRAVNAISQEQWGKATESVVKGFMYYTGMPVAGFEDIEKAVETGKPQRVIGIK